MGEEAGRQAHALWAYEPTSRRESAPASEDGKGKGRVMSVGCGTSEDIGPWAQGSQFSFLGFLEVGLTGFLHVFQEVRDSILQSKGDCHFFVFVAVTSDFLGCH